MSKFVELQAVAGIIKEHRQWAKKFGSACALVLQGDYSEIDAIAREVRYEFPDGEPEIKSAALADGRKVGIPC